MPLFSKKAISDDKTAEEESGLKDNISTMSDALVTAIEAKNRTSELSSKKSSQPKQHNRSDELTRDLADVYTDPNGRIPDLTHLVKEDRPWWRTLIYVLICVFSVLFVASVAAYLVITNWSNQSFTNENISFKIVPPISIVSGQPQEYTMIIANNEKVNLYNLNIELNYPNGFAYVSGTPEATGGKSNIWDLSVLKVGEQKEIKFMGMITASVGTMANLSGTLTFKPENLNADFNQKASVDFGVASSNVIAQMTGPDKIKASDLAEYSVYLKNIGDKALSDIEVTAEYPTGFSPASSTPNPKEGFDNLWVISSLATSTASTTATTTDKKLVIRGRFNGVLESGNGEIKIKVETVSGGERLLLAEQSFVSSIVKNQLELSLVVNGSGEDQPAGFGDLLFYTLKFKNTGQDEINKAEIVAHLNGDLVDWATFADDNKGKAASGDITWTSKEISQLLSIKPGDEGQISWQVRLKDLANISAGEISKYSVENSAQMNYIGSDGQAVSAISNTIVNAINSDIGIKAAARYYDENNVALGSGPIGPKTGEASSYNIKIQLANNIHDIGNIEVTAVLPKNVSWDNKENHDTGDVAFASKTNKFQWKISRLPKTAKGANADFNISITPAETDAGRVLILLPEIKLTAKDLDTGADISKTFKAITTSFDDPIIGQVSGIVE